MDDFFNSPKLILCQQPRRRNLTPDAFKLLLGRRYNRQKKAAHGRADRDFSGDQFDPPKSTASKLAKEHGTSEATVKRAGRFAEEVERTPELKAAIWRLLFSGVSRSWAAMAR